MLHATIYTTPSCTKCTTVKNLLNNKNISFTECKIGEDISIEALYKKIGTSVKSVPQIFLDDTYIKSIEELKTIIG